MVLVHWCTPAHPRKSDVLNRKRWEPPPQGWIMVNVDAAIFHKDNRMGLCIVIRDERGVFLAACKQGIDKITDPELAETIAFRRAVNFASQLPHDHIIIAPVESHGPLQYWNYHRRHKKGGLYFYCGFFLYSCKHML